MTTPRTGILPLLGLLLVPLWVACNPEPVEVKVQIQGAGIGDGVVTWNGTGGNQLIACIIHAGQVSGDCEGKGDFSEGRNSATIFASPDQDSWVESWAGCEASSGSSCEIAWDKPGGEEVRRVLTARFERDPLIAIRLRVHLEGNGVGSVSTRDQLPAEEITCSLDREVTGTCEVHFEDVDGTGRIELSPSASPPNRLSQWTGCTSVTPSGGCMVEYTSTQDIDLDVTARFEWPPFSVTASVGGAGNGSGRVVSSFPGGDNIDCTLAAGTLTGTCEVTFTDDRARTAGLSATPSTGSVFAEWTGCSSITNQNHCNVSYPGTGNVSAVITARFDASILGPGEFIVFNGDPDGGGTQRNRIMVVSASGLTSLTSGDAEETEPSWSPDGSRIVFRSKRDEADGDIWVMDANGGNAHKRTGSDVFDHDPDWSLSNQVVFVSNREGNDELYLLDMNSETSAPVRLTISSEEEVEPTLSPDGSRVAFTRKEDDGIWIMNATPGALPTRVQGTGAGDKEPSWSPDGASLAFTRRHEVHITALDGTGLRQITSSSDDGDPVFSPDGASIAFTRGSGSGSQIYIISLVTPGPRQLVTTLTGDNENLDWIRKP